MGWKNGREWGRGFSAESKEREGEERKREVLRFIELHKASNTGRGPNREGCDDVKTKLNDRHEINPRVRRYDASGAMRRFQYDADNSLEAHNVLKDDGFTRAIKRDAPRDDSSEGSSKDGKMAKSKRVKEDTDYEEDKKLMPEGEPEGKQKRLRKDITSSPTDSRKEVALTSR
ncbi:hypothetical protein AgCh_011861 [Apium graveolens]